MSRKGKGVPPGTVVPRRGSCTHWDGTWGIVMCEHGLKVFVHVNRLKNEIPLVEGEVVTVDTVRMPDGRWRAVKVA